MPALRLKTKLVFAITGMVVAIVATLAALYISEVVHQRIEEAYDSSLLIGHEVFNVARNSLEVDLASSKMNVHNSREVASAVQEVLQTDSGINALLESVEGYSQTIYDAAIVDSNGQALLHSNQELLGKPVPARQDFSIIATAGIRKQMKVIYGPPQVYDVRVPLLRDGMPFGEVRIGISTVFLKSAIRDQMRRALALSAGAILVCLVLSAGLSNFALRPLAAISRRLDMITSGHVELAEAPAKRSDEYARGS